MTLGLSISGATFVNEAQTQLYALLPNIPRADVGQIVSGTSSQVLASLSDTVREQALNIIVSAWHNTYVVLFLPPACASVPELKSTIGSSVSISVRQ